MDRFTNWLRGFMLGRYGVDHLSFAMLLPAMALMLLGRRRLWPLELVGLALMVWADWRILSRNISARAQENGVFLRYWQGARGAWDRLTARIKDRDHRYYRCPRCRQQLRVPRGRGRIVITCPKCRHEFVKKT